MKLTMFRVALVVASFALFAAPGCKTEQPKQDTQKEELAAKVKADAEARQKAAEEAATKAEAEAKAKVEAEAIAAQEAKLKAEADAKAAEEARIKAEEEAKAAAEAEVKAAEEAKLKAEADAQARGMELVDKAIAASGGLDALAAKFSAYTIKSKGTYAGMPYEMTTWWKAPDRIVMDVTSMGMAMGYVGDDCWSRMGDLVMDCSEREKAGVPMMQWAGHVSTLYPIKGEGFVATFKGEAELDGSKVGLVDVTKESAPGVVTFAFDLETGLPSRLDHPGTWAGQDGLLSMRVLAYTEVEGVKLPAKTEMFFQDSRVMEDELVSANCSVVDEAVFVRPAQVAGGTTRIKPVPEHIVVFGLHKGTHETIGATIGQVYGCIGANQLIPTGGPVLAYLKDPSQTKNPEEYETEVMVGIGPTALETLQGEGCAMKTIPACEVAARVEFGPYDKAAANYPELAKWAKKNKYRISGPALMATYGDPTTTAPEGLISELMFVVRKK
jgi:effector-binding domain-containing protein